MFVPNLKTMFGQGTQNSLLLYCEITWAIRQGFSVYEFVDRHINNMDYKNDSPYWVNVPGLIFIRPEHELCHLLLGLAFKKMGRNPLPFDFGYDGNHQAEALVVAMELALLKACNKDSLWVDKKEFPAIEFEDFTVDYFKEKVRLIYKESLQNEDQNNLVIFAKIADAQNEPATIFNARSLELRAQSSTRDLSPGEQTRWGEDIPIINPIPEDVIEEVYRTVFPALRVVNEILHRNRGAFANAMFPINFLNPIIPNLDVANLWYVMDNPEDSFDIATLFPPPVRGP